MAVTNSIVIINFNNKPTLLALLMKLRLQEAMNTEVIVVDNASFDGSREAVEEDFPTVKMLPLKSNRGFFAAMNKGLDRASADAVVVCHADVLADVHTFSELADQAREVEANKVAAVLPRILGVDDVEQPFVATLPTLTSGIAGAISPAVGIKCTVPFLDHLTQTEWARFVCVAINRNYLTNLGLLDEKFFLYYGDTDFCARIHAKQLRVLISKTVKVTHMGPAPGKDMPEHLTRIAAKDQETYREKHLAGLKGGLISAAASVRGWFAKS